MLKLFSLAIVLSAFMLFLVQPLAAKVVLPVLGGAPAVWATCMLFFQIVLLAGYAYAHLLSSRVAPRTQVFVHAGVVLASCLTLPIGLPENFPPPPPGNPTFWLIQLLTVALGAPFFVVSSTGPLLTRWFSRTDDPRAADPYFLYAASNAGSIGGLLAYPFAIEPTLTLTHQRQSWSIAYLVLLSLILACGWAARRHLATRSATREQPPAPKPVGRRRLRWVLLAMVPCSLMLGVTQHISTDIAAIPLMWVIPLLLYLLSFILAFSSRVGIPSVRVGRWFLVVALFASAGLLLQFQLSALLHVTLLLAAVFLASWMCHKMLAEDRPAPEHLTGFFMLVSVGGVMGGVFNALVAPLIFNSIAEFPYIFALALLLRPGSNPKRQPWANYWAPALIVGVLAIAAVLVTDARLMTTKGEMDVRDQVLVKLGPTALLIAAMWVWGGSFRAAGVLACALLTIPLLGRYALLLHRERTFFGVYDVIKTVDGGGHILWHGTTIHGVQTVIDERRLIPASYYHPSSPIGDIMQVKLRQRKLDNVAIVGMGVGTMAAYGVAGMTISFYEIDPAIVSIAADPKLFTYLAESHATVGSYIGDGRKRMEEAAPGLYDVIALDAFSSDAIPVHLITREAFEKVYVPRLAERGIIAIHISNRYFDLSEPLSRIALDLNLAVAIREDFDRTQANTIEGKKSSVWVAIARTQDDLKELLSAPDWVPLPDAPPGRTWTDDYVNLLDVMEWRAFFFYR